MSPTLIYLLAAYVLLALLIYLVQEKFIFKPEKLPQDFAYKYDLPFEELFFQVDEGISINGLHFYCTEPKGLVLYFHGNSKVSKAGLNMPGISIAISMM